MFLDYNSLLIAIGFSSACLAVTLFSVWLSSRRDGFLLTWAAGALLIVGNVFAYSTYFQRPSLFLGMLALGLLILGMSVIFAAAGQFRQGRLDVWRLVAVASLSLLLMLTPFALGLDGLAIIAANLLTSGLLFATAREYWLGRAEAPLQITGVTVLYSLTGTSFALCAGVLVADGDLVLGKAPDNWAEDLNLVVAIAGLTGIGALSLALNQSRLARGHRRDAMTDPLTGLLNRRALFGSFGKVPVAPHTAVIVFDLDGFKGINDQYGHAVGDQVLVRFATALRDNARATDSAARLGGEEFALVLPGSTQELAELVAERIRAIFASGTIETERGPVQCTVSAGVAFVAQEGQAFDTLLNFADNALYLAKRDGRNRVVSPRLRLVG